MTLATLAIRLLVALFLASSVNSLFLSRPAKCEEQETWFKTGEAYSYRYYLEAKSGVTGSNPDSIDTRHVTCDIIINVQHECEMVLLVQSCTVGPSLDQPDLESSLKLSEEMTQFPVYFKYNKGEVMDHEIVINMKEPLYITNLKRGFISLLQLKMMSSEEHYNAPVEYHDIFGSCKTHIKFVPGKLHQMETYRDLSFCNLRGSLHYQNSVFSMIQMMQSDKPTPMFTQLFNPVESSVTCQYKVTSDLLMEEASCSQPYSYIPLFFNDYLTANIRQSMQFQSRERLKSKTFYRFLPEYVEVDLAMDFDNQPKVYIDGDATKVSLEKSVTDLFSQDLENVLPAKSFKLFISHLRNSEEQQIRIIKNSIKLCEDAGIPFKRIPHELDLDIAQGLKRKLFVNGLMSCGTESCLVVLAEMLKDDICGFENMHILFNMGLFYEANVKVIEIIHDHCTSKSKNTQCWLSLSAMLSRLKPTGTEDKIQAKNLLSKVVKKLDEFIGTKCQQQFVKLDTHHKIKRENSLLTALKALGNIGQLPFDLESKETLNQKLMDCIINNNQKDLIIAQNSLNALVRTGLLENNSGKLMKVLQDDGTEMALRSNIFDVFVFQENVEILQQLLSLLDSTKLDTMKTYIVTKVLSIVESPDSNRFRLQNLLQEIMKERKMPEVNNIVSTSHYAEVSHDFKIPLTPFHVGGMMGISVIFNPASNFFQTFTLKCGIILNGERVDIIEVMLYLEGIDTLVDVIKELKNNPSKVIHSSNLMKSLHMYINEMSKGKIPTFDQLDPQLMKRIRDIFNKANMKKAVFPRGHMSIKLFGYDVTFHSTESLLKLFKEKKRQFKGGLAQVLLKEIQSVFINTFKFSDFNQKIPTAGGLPLEFELDSTVVMKALVNSTRKLRDIDLITKELIINWSLLPSLSISKEAKMVVSLGNYFKTDLRHHAWAKGMASLSTNAKGHPLTFQQSPGFFLDISKSVDQEMFTFLDARSETYLQTRWGKILCDQPENLMESFDKCLPDIYTKMLGHKVCLNGNYYHNSPQEMQSVFPKLASTKIIGTLTPIDKELKAFRISGFYQGASFPSKGYQLQANFEGQGSELSRNIFFSTQHNLKDDIDDYAYQISLEDVSLVIDIQSFKKKNHETFAKRMSMSVTQNEITLHSVKVLQEEAIDMRTNGENEIVTEANITLAMGDLSMAFSRKKTKNPYTSNSDFLEFRYHCKPSLPLLYALHPNPLIASKSHHTSTFSLLKESESSKTSFTDTWNGMFKDILIVPGHNINHISRFVADLKGANRTTNVTWTVGREMHIYNMDGHVLNKTVSGFDKYDYKMHLVKLDEFVTDLEGHLTWTPMKGFQLEGVVNFQSLKANVNHNILRKRRSLSSILKKLRRGEERVKKTMARKFAAAKTGLWTIWKGKEKPLSKSKNQRVQLDNFQGSINEEKVNIKKVQENSKPSLMNIPKWDLDFKVDVSMKPDVLKTPVGMKMIGMHFDWLANVTMFKGKEMMFLTRGDFDIGKKFKASCRIEDNIHHTEFDAEVEHLNNEKIFYHRHKWHLSEKHMNELEGKIVNDNLHVTNRSFGIFIHFEHYKHLECDIKLRSLLTNLTYHLNYTKSAERAHLVRVHAIMDSTLFPFTLRYNESSDILDGKQDTRITMNSSLLDMNFTLSKTLQNKGLSIDAHSQYKIKLPFYFYTKERDFDVHFQLVPRQPPTCKISYYPDLGKGGIEITITFLGPKRIQLRFSSLPVKVKDTLIGVLNKDSNTLLVWTVDLIAARVIQHTMKISPHGAKMMQSMIDKSVNKLMERVEQMSDIIQHNVLSDFKDAVTPLSQKGIEEMIRDRLKLTLQQNPQSPKVNVLKLLIGGVQTWSHLLKQLPISIVFRALHFNEGIAFGTKLSTKILGELVHQPPFFLRQFAKVYIYPHLHAAMKGKEMIMTTSLPFVLKSFVQLPQGTIIDKEIMEEMQAPTIPSFYRDMAVLMNGRWIRTFDGRWFNIVDSPGLTCVHLIAGDFRKNKFVMLYSKIDGLTVLSKQSGININTNGDFTSLDGKLVSSLPHTSPDKELSLTIREGKLSLLISHGLVRVTFDSSQKIYLFEIAKEMNNASLGILGTNNKESGDDFRLIDGTNSQSSLALQNNFELSQSQYCHVSKEPSTFSCLNNDKSVCHNFFSKGHDVSACAHLLNPHPFNIQCQTEECLSKSGCKFVRAYATICHHIGISVKLPAECDQCKQKSYNKIDIVFVQSLKEEVFDNRKGSYVALNSVNALSSSDVKIGFVTYGGAGLSQTPKAHLIQQRLFGTVQKNMKLPSLTMNPGKSTTSPEEAIDLAAAYPFRGESTRLIVLVHSTEPHEMDVDQLTNTLTRKNIHFISVTERAEYNKQGIVGVLHNGQSIGNQKRMQMPKDNNSVLVKKTKGAWLSKDAFKDEQTDFFHTIVTQMQNLFDTKGCDIPKM